VIFVNTKSCLFLLRLFLNQAHLKPFLLPTLKILLFFKGRMAVQDSTDDFLFWWN